MIVVQAYADQKDMPKRQRPAWIGPPTRYSVLESRKDQHYAKRQAYAGGHRILLPEYLLRGVIIFVLLSVALACSSGTKDTTPTTTTSPFPKGLKPADADAPTAGICAQPPSGDVVTITINVDVPSPRCSQIKATQRLQVINNTGAAVEIDLGAVYASVGPGEGQTLDRPVGTYLAPGVHLLRTAPLAGGAEIWLIDGNSSHDEAPTVGVGTARASSPVATLTPTPVVLPSGRQERLLMPGTAQETPLYLIGSGRAGPVVLVIGGVHGDEPGGWLAAEQVTDLKPELGTLLVVPRANRQAISVGSRTTPELGDLNRLYPGDAQGLPMARMAAEILALIEEHGVNVVLDLHESWGFYTERPYDSRAFLGQTITTSPSDVAASFAQAVLGRVNEQILDPREMMVYREYPPRRTSETTTSNGSGGSVTVPAGGSSSLGLGRSFPEMVVMLVEMSQQQPLETRVDLHVLVVEQTLEVLGM